MKKSDIYLLIGIVYIAPHMTPWISVLTGVLAILRACVEATKE